MHEITITKTKTLKNARFFLWYVQLGHSEKLGGRGIIFLKVLPGETFSSKNVVRRRRLTKYPIIL
jgi:hypothetical protein